MLLHWKLTENKKKPLFKIAPVFETILLASTHISLYWEWLILQRTHELIQFPAVGG